MEKRKGVFGLCNQKHRQVVATGLVFLLFVGTTPPALWANPIGEAIKAGNATFTRDGNNLIIKQGSDRMVVNWQSFSIGKGELTKFIQPGTKSSALNRVLGGTRSLIDGRLEANGQVVLVNPAGITVGANGVVNVNSFIGSTLDITDENFMAGGDLKFSGDSEADIVNLGTIKAETGDVFLLAKTIDNQGTIEAPNGTVGLGAGSEIVIQPEAGEKLYIAPASKKGGSITNKGAIRSAAAEIKAAGNPYALAINLDGVVDVKGTATKPGKVKIDAGAGNVNIAKTATVKARKADSSGGEIHVVTTGNVNNEGLLDARGEQGKGGLIRVQADHLGNIGIFDASGPEGGTIAIKAKQLLQQGTFLAEGKLSKGGLIGIDAGTNYVDTVAALLSVKGATDGGSIRIDTPAATSRIYSSSTMDASGQSGKGGSVVLTSQELYLMGSKLIADGLQGGGTVLAGGDYHGANPDVRNAETVWVGSTSKFTANALGSGNGGKVVVWSDGSTTFSGAVEAKAAASSGDGGQLEVSGLDQLGFYGTANASAPAGKAGSLLLDPKNIIIDPSGGGFSSGGNPILFEFIDPNKGPENAFGTFVAPLTTGNVVIAAPGYSPGGATYAGAVYLFNGATGALISSLLGDHENDSIGGNGITVLSNGNFVVGSPYWNGGRGAATWGSGITGVSGVVSSSNSLVGTHIGSPYGNDQIGNSVKALANGNYVTYSTYWNSARGAVTWGNGFTGTFGEVSATNSLVGDAVGDDIGRGITELTNGNYVVNSDLWHDYTGAVTWVNGTNGHATNESSTGAVVSASNSLVGSASGYSVGDEVGFVTALANGNYVVASQYWGHGRGAVTWANGSTGLAGAISESNSLIGVTRDTGQHYGGDEIGSGGVIALSNGNYVISSSKWGLDKGAVTWVNGSNGWIAGSSSVNGTISAANSLVGSTSTYYDGSWHYGDFVGGVVALTNGNYVVTSNNWGNYAERGAITWGDGSTNGTRLVGVVSAANSLIGNAGDQLGEYGYNYGVKALPNGNYVILSSNWNGDRGAVTWQDGSAGGSRLLGTAISSSNSLVGSNAGDEVGLGGFLLLSNGNYVVSSYKWNNQRGAATWANGTTGISGLISSSNSLVGSAAGDRVGSGFADQGDTLGVALTNGNYVVLSPVWGAGLGAGWGEGKGAATWGNGATGITGEINAGNSLIGQGQYDQIGYYGATALGNGNYVVNSSLGELYTDPNPDYGVYPVSKGAATWGNGGTGTVGFLTTENTIFGGSLLLWGYGVSTYADNVNNTFITAVPEDTSAGGMGRVYAGSANGPSGGSTSGILYADDPSATKTFSPSALVDVLKTGTDLILQANNDITINSGANIVVSNPSGNGGTLTLQAGRSITINSSITTDNGNLILIANDTKANGVVDAYRDAGVAAITMGAGTSINAGTGNVSITLSDGAGNTNRDAGGISLRGISGGKITVVNKTGGVTLNSQLLTTAAGTAIEIAGKSFTNGVGSLLFATSPGSNWRVWTEDPSKNALNGLTPAFKQYDATYGSSTVLGSGNGLLYTIAPTVTAVVTGEISKTYDGGTGYRDKIDDRVLTVTGAIDGDEVRFRTDGKATFASANAGSGLGVTVDGISISSTSNGDVQIYGYKLDSTTATGDTGRITPATVFITLDGVEKVYDGTTAASLDGKSFQISGLVGDENITVLKTTGVFNSADVLTANSVTASLSLSDFLADDGTLLSNYALPDAAVGSGTIKPKSLEAQIVGTITKTYDATTNANLAASDFSVTGLIDGESVTVSAKGSYNSANVKDAATVSTTLSDKDFTAASGTKLSNYVLPVSVTGAGAITTKELTVSGSIRANNKTYDGTSIATVDEKDTRVQLVGVAGEDNVRLQTDYIFADANAGSGIVVSLDKVSLLNNDLANYTLNLTGAPTTTASIRQKELSIEITGPLTKVYDSSDYIELTSENYSVTGLIDGQSVSINQTAGFFNSGNVLEANLVRAFLSEGTVGAGAGTLLSNYTLPEIATGAGTITPKGVTVTGSFTVADKTYDGTRDAVVIANDLILDGAIGKDSLTIDPTASFASKDAATGILVTLSDASKVTGGNGNYTISFDGAPTATANISPKEIFVTALGGSSVYGESPTNPGLESKDLVAGETVDVLTGLYNKFDITNLSSAGEYTLEVGGELTNKNYVVTSAAWGSWTVKQKGVTVTALGGSSVYGESPTDPGLSVDGLANGESADVLKGIRNSFGISNFTNAGDYELTVAGDLEWGNYFIEKTNNGSWTVNKKGITVTALGGSSTYGDSPANPGLSAEGLVNGETLDVLAGLSSDFSITNLTHAGEYTLKVSGTLGNENYEVIGTVDGTWTVGRKGVTVTALGGTSTYGESPINPGLSADGMVNGEAVADLTGLSNSFGISNTTNAGNHALTVAGELLNKDYEIISTIAGEWIVNKKDIRVTALGGDSIYGDKPENPGLSSDDLANGETVAVLKGLSNSFGISNTTNAGSYTLTVEGVLDGGNYNLIGTKNGEWVVAKKDIVVSAVGGSSIYGESPENPGVTSDGLVNGETGAVLAGLKNSFGITGLSDAGDYILGVEGKLEDGNYNVIGTTDGKWTVGKKGLVVTALGGSSVYGESPVDPGLSADGLVNGQTIAELAGLSNSFGITGTTDADRYALAVNGALEHKNYFVAEAKGGTWIVNKKDITVTALGGSSTYGDKPKNPGLGAEGLVNDQTVDVLGGISNSFDITNLSDAGDYVLKVAGELTNKNYTITKFVDGTWTVGKKDIVVTALGGASTYGDKSKDPGLSAEGLVNDQSVDALTGLNNSFDITNLTDAGDYVLKVAGELTNKNYAITKFVDGTWTVGKKSIVVTALGGNSIYGDKPENPGLSASGLVNEQGVDVLTGLANSFAVTNLTYAGIYTTKVAGELTNKNYTITELLDGTWTVSKKDIVVTALGGNSIYGDKPSDPGLSATGLVNDQGVDVLSGLTNSFSITNLTDAGDYTLKVRGELTNENYNITELISGKWTVGKKDIIVAAIGGTSIYGDAPKDPGLSAVGLVNDQTVEALTGLGSSFAIKRLTDAGTYTLEVLGELANDNYNITARNSGEWIVTPKDIVVTANGGTSTYGDKPKNPGLSVDGLVNEQLVDVLTGLGSDFGITNLTDAGSYTLKVTGDLTNKNYHVASLNDGTWIVGRKDITVTALGGASTYGDAPENPGFTADGLVNDQTVEVLSGLRNGFGITKLSDAGDHTLQIAGELTNGNYNVVKSIDGTWHVSPKEIYVTANGGTSVYGDKPRNPGLSAEGLVNEQTVDVLTGLFNDLPVTNFTSVGEYRTNVGGELTNGNYVVGKMGSGGWTVTPASLTITANDQSKVYGTNFEFKGDEYTAVGLVNGESAGLLKFTSKGAPGYANVGSYEIAISPLKGMERGAPVEGKGFNPYNYDITIADGNFTVTRAPIVVRAVGGESQQGQSPANPGVVLVSGALFNGDTLASLHLINSFGITSGTSAGNYLLKVLGDASNYDITTVGGTWIVAALPVTPGNTTKNADQFSQPPPESMDLTPGTFMGTTPVSGPPTGGTVKVEIEGFDSMFSFLGLDPEEGAKQVDSWSATLDPNKDKEE